MNNIVRRNRSFQVPEGFQYHVGEQDGVKYLVIPISQSLGDDQLCAFSVDEGILFVCDISQDDGMALAFPGIEGKDLDGAEIILLSPSKQQYYCRDVGYDW